MTATPNGQAWSSSWSRVSTWSGWRISASSSENSRGLRSTRAAFDRDRSADVVEHDRAARDERRRGRRRPAGDRPETGRQLGERKGLDEVVVGARVEAGNPVRDGVARGEEQDRDRTARSADPARHLDARDVGEAHVEHDRVDAARGEIEAITPRGRDVDDVALAGQQLGEKVREARIVLDHEDVHRVQYRATGS